MAISTSPSVARVGDVSFSQFVRRLLRWLASATSLSVALLKSKVCWFSSNLSLGGSSPPSFPSVAHLKSKDRRIKVHRAQEYNAQISVNGEDEAMTRSIGVKAAKAKAKRGTSYTHTEMEARKLIVCGLSASRIRPPLPQEENMVELSREEYMRNIDYFIRVEESEDDIEPEFRRMLKRMHEEEKKLREKKFKVLKLAIKLEDGQSSKGDGKKRKRKN
ncbi:hypothetical protein F2Q68_00029768 [Brassica cretica]|uniref:Uncharacterized protein n=1 Tax=Brassica cretica TaxID=69181 RepID=A0A8S9G5Z4_BRACR|nr:hypothetical protein F2Q68_00029768 [Brassica cretica]